MHEISTSAAVAAPPDPHALRAARVVGRVRVGRSVADLLALLAHGEPRGDLAALASVTSCRTAAAGAVLL